MTKKLFILSAIALVLAAGVIMLKSSGQSAGALGHQPERRMVPAPGDRRGAY